MLMLTRISGRRNIRLRTTKNDDIGNRGGPVSPDRICARHMAYESAEIAASFLKKKRNVIDVQAVLFRRHPCAKWVFLNKLVENV